ncbi:MAG TPA: hypothetical protein VK988_01715 [Acidimicrobiales bacterium]|nr:hypothetical protein [Acidimicrobiales bacterium]
MKVGDAEFGKPKYVVASRGGLPAAFAYHEARTIQDQKDKDPCVTRSFYCHLYTVNVAEGGATLRVAMESSKRGECYGLEVKDPNGQRQPHGGFRFVCPEISNVFLNFQSYNIETFVRPIDEKTGEPVGVMPGPWQIRVLGIEVEDWAYRVRAALEGAPRDEPELLTPNLTPWLPSEFGFIAPASPNAGTAPDHLNPPGTPGVSCHADDGESADPEAQKPSKCLRFSSGVYNNGDGPLYLRFDDKENPEHPPAYQRVYYSKDKAPGYYDNNENTYLERLAGAGKWHDSHKHRHFQDMVLYQLFEVSDPLPTLPSPDKKVLTEVDQGQKYGYCTFSQRIERWREFGQDGQLASFPPIAIDKDLRSCNDAMTLERGWGDVYRWQRPGQYVPYDRVADPDGTMRAGFYVVRVTVDPNDLLLETRESDNRGYAYIRVIDGLQPNSDTVVVCELGYGKSPWDPSKKVVQDSFSWAKQLTMPTVGPGTC